MEMLERPSWDWGLLLTVLTMSIHAGAVVLMACASMSIRVRLESRHLDLSRVMLILICIIGVIGLLFVVVHVMMVIKSGFRRQLRAMTIGD